MPRKEPEVIYYEDELNDDFSPTNDKITPIVVDEHYVYLVKNPFKRFLSFTLRRVILPFVAFCYNRINYQVVYRNRKVLKKAKKTGYFIYGNHTQLTPDAFIPFELTLPKEGLIIVSRETVSIPFVGNIAKALGAIPLPSDIKATKHFLEYIEKKIKVDKAAIGIYPEAHIWPFYTGIRPFGDGSFHYPVKYNVPVFCFTNTYHKKRFGKKPRIITYVDGPFYPDESLSTLERKKKLRDQVYEAMKKRSEESDYSYIQYRKKEEKGDN